MARHVRASDLRAVTRLATQATLATTRISEGVHQSVWRTMGVPGGKQPDRARGLTALVYRCVTGITHAVGIGLDAALSRLQPLLDAMETAPADSPQRLAVLAALNGVMGDRLLADANPLALPMSLHRGDGQLVDADAPAIGVSNGKVLLMVHGLCMNDRQWQTWRKDANGVLVPGLDHGAELARSLGYQPLYLRYNSGRHISDNGDALALLLERLVASWPVPVVELSGVGHSMGGLVLRSAVLTAKAAGMAWPSRLKNLVFLGSPHHGAPMERAGRWVDQLLGRTPYTAPFARLARLRSCGITDLRHGNVSRLDWQGQDRHASAVDSRQSAALPAGVACFAIAACLAERRGALAERLMGDGIVPLRSALGEHADPARALQFPAGHTRVRYGIGHLQLLSDQVVARQMRDWLTAAPAGRA